MGEHIERMPEVVRDFCKRNKSSQFHSIYHLETFDMNGNKTDEKFGMNLITNYGLKSVYGTGWGTGWDVRIRIGRGTAPTPSQTSLNSPITSDYATYINFWRDTLAGPMVYDPDTKLMTYTYKLVQGYYDYNINDTSGSKITTAVDVTEIAVSRSGDVPFLIAAVYDSNGIPSSITKRPNERLYITVYFQTCINVNLINLLWDQGYYALLSPRMFSFDPHSGSFNYHRFYCGSYFGRSAGCVGSWSSLQYTDNDDIKYSPCWPTSWNYETSFSSWTDSYKGIRISFSAPAYTFDQYPGTQYFSGCQYNDTPAYSKDEGFKTITYWHVFNFEEMDESDAETIVTYDGWTNDCTSGSFSNLFGGYNYQGKCADYLKWLNQSGELPMTNLKVTHCDGYNHLTKSWDIDKMNKFVHGGRDMKYEYFNWRRALVLYMDVYGAERDIYIYCNPLNQYTISGFNNTNINVFAATDEYWNTTTYEYISDISNIPSDLRHKRYYIIISGTAQTLNPIYVDDYDSGDTTGYCVHRIIPDHNTVNISSVIGNVNTVGYRGLCRGCSSDANNWFAFQTYVVHAPDLFDSSTWTKHYLIPYPITSSNYDWGYMYFRYCTDDRIICPIATATNSMYGKTVRIYNLSDFSQTNLPYEDISTGITSTNTNLIVSFSKVSSTEAYMVIQSTSHNSAVIIDVYAKSAYLIPGSPRGCFCNNLSKYCVYQDAGITETSTFNVLDMSTNEIVDTFTLNTDHTYTVRGIVGWKNHVYINVLDNESTSYVYYYDINDKSITRIDDTHTVLQDITSYSLISNAGYTSNDEVFVACSNGNIGACFITDDEPTKIRNIFNDDSNGCTYAYHYAAFPQLKYMNDGKSLILTMGLGADIPFGDYNSRYGFARIIDLGYIIDNYDDGGIVNWPTNRFPNINFYNESNPTYYARLCGTQIPYKDGVICERWLSDTNDTKIWYPIELCLPYRIEGTTTTINNYNNPMYVSGKTMTLTVSNDMSKIRND